MVLENRPEPILEEDHVDPAGPAAPPQYSADGKLTVKIKLPKPAEEEPRPAPPEAGAAGGVKTHFCADCNRSFSSGKALGGHMSSAHVQANRDLSMKKLKSRMGQQQKSGSCSGSGPETGIICEFCGKDFPSMKSLFGHLRCHPDRGWRGMTRPAETVANDSYPPEQESNDAVGNHDLEEGNNVYEQTDSGRDPDLGLGLSLQGWSVTAKRGRRCLKPGSEDKELYDAVHQLIRLVNDVGSGKRKFDDGKDHNSGSFNTPHGPEFTNRNSGFEDPKKPDLPVSAKKPKISDVGKGKDVFVSYEDYYYSSSSSSSDNDDDVNFGTKRKIDMGKKSKLVNGISEESQHEENIYSSNSSPDDNNNNKNKDKFICNTCKKRFPTHQALGGHRSSHNKFKLSIYNTIDEQNANAMGNDVDDDDNYNSDNVGFLVSDPGQELMGRGGGRTRTRTVHLCKICKESFGSVEELRSHRRIHWNIPIQERERERERQCCDEIHRTDGRGLGFDLNEVPDGDEEDGV